LGAITGELMARGIKRRDLFPRVSQSTALLSGRQEFSPLPERYEIRPVTALAWAVKLKDELKFSFDITARKHA